MIDFGQLKKLRNRKVQNRLRIQQAAKAIYVSECSTIYNAYFK